MQNHFPQHRSHNTCGAGADDILHIREIFLKHAAFIICHFGDVAGRNPHTVIGKHAKRRGLLKQRDFCRAQRHRQIRRDVRCDPKAMGVINHAFYPETVGQLQRGNVARLRQRAPQRDHPFKFLVVIVRDIWPGGSLKRDRHIEHGVIGVRALVDSGGIYVRLERRSHLAQRLGCSVELR